MKHTIYKIVSLYTCIYAISQNLTQLNLHVMKEICIFVYNN